MRDTDPDLAAPEPRARRFTQETTSARKHLYMAAASLLTALGVAIPALVQSCQLRAGVSQAKQGVAETRQEVKETKQEAVEAKVVAGAGYAATKTKLDPTSEEVVQLRKDVNAIKAELAAQRARREQRAGRRARPTAPPPDPVAPEVAKPLPATPAAAAAATDAAPPAVK
jgi:hypothetical protein